MRERAATTEERVSGEHWEGSVMVSVYKEPVSE
jgi:hypothetical protein